MYTLNESHMQTNEHKAADLAGISVSIVDTGIVTLVEPLGEGKDHQRNMQNTQHTDTVHHPVKIINFIIETLRQESCCTYVL